MSVVSGCHGDGVLMSVVSGDSGDRFIKSPRGRCHPRSWCVQTRILAAPRVPAAWGGGCRGWGSPSCPSSSRWCTPCPWHLCPCEASPSHCVNPSFPHTAPSLRPTAPSGPRGTGCSRALWDPPPLQRAPRLLLSFWMLNLSCLVTVQAEKMQSTAQRESNFVGVCVLLQNTHGSLQQDL